MAKVNFIRGTKAAIDNRAISDGNLLFATDTGVIYLDSGNQRISFYGGGAYLPISGGTITGNLTVNGTPTFNNTVNVTAKNVHINDSGFDISSTPTTVASRYFGVRDANDRYVMYLGGGQETDGTSVTTLYARRYNNSANDNNGVTLKVAPDGTKTVAVTSPAAWRKALGIGDSDGAFPLTVAQGGTGNTTGNAPSATKLAAARNLKVALGSEDAASFDGSASASIGVGGTLAVGHGGTGKSTLTSGSYLVGNGDSAVSLKTPAQVLSDIGAAASGHTHSYLPLSGGTLTGTLTMDNKTVYIKDTALNITSAPSSGGNSQSLRVQDSNSNDLAIVSGRVGTDGFTGLRLSGYNAAGTNHTVFLGWKNGTGSSAVKAVDLSKTPWNTALCHGYAFGPYASALTLNTTTGVTRWISVSGSSATGGFATSNEELFSRASVSYEDANRGVIRCLVGGTVAVGATLRFTTSTANLTEVALTPVHNGSTQIGKVGMHVTGNGYTGTITLAPIFVTVSANDTIGMKIFYSNSITIAANEIYLSVFYVG